MSRNPTIAKEAAQTAWRALATLIAGQPRVRLSKDGGKSYPTAGERRLQNTLPTVPAAVRLCGTDGTVATIALDFDVSNGDTSKVNTDVTAVQRWLTRHGALWIEDCSPTGGRHVYIPLTKRVGFTEARHFVEAMSLRHTSIDPGPHRSADVGCIRTPGSPHKRGGYQVLTMSLSDAYAAAIIRNAPTIWEALRGSLKEELAVVTQQRNAPQALIEDTEYLPLSNGPRNLPSGKNRLARTGLYNTGTYDSPSEARQAVLASAVAAGWELTDVQRLMHNNTWAGMTSFYSRYTSQQRSAALRRDWMKAVSYVAERRKKHGRLPAHQKSAHKSYTSPINTQGGPASLAQPGSTDEYRFLKDWNLARETYELKLRGTREGLTLRLLLRALGEAAAKAGSRFIEFGVRSLALAVGVHHTTVARLLRRLTNSKDAPIRLAAEGRGTRGDLYELQTPDHSTRAQENRKWRKGHTHALRPAFRGLGVTAAFTYETIELSDVPLSTSQIIQGSGLSPAATASALETLAAWNLVQKIDGHWSLIGATSLRAIAEYLGVLEELFVQLARYRVERLQWRNWLDNRQAGKTLQLLEPDQPYPFWDREAPDDNGYTLTDLFLGRTTKQIVDRSA